MARWSDVCPSQRSQMTGNPATKRNCSLKGGDWVKTSFVHEYQLTCTKRQHMAVPVHSLLQHKRTAVQGKVFLGLCWTTTTDSWRSSTDRDSHQLLDSSGATGSSYNQSEYSSQLYMYLSFYFFCIKTTTMFHFVHFLPVKFFTCW